MGRTITTTAVTMGLVLAFLALVLSPSLAQGRKAIPAVQIDCPESQSTAYMTLSATFGAPAPDKSEPFRTRLYTPREYFDGCGAEYVLAPPDQENDWTIVLMRGGICSFKDKVLRAQNKGAKAVIIINSVRGLYNTTDKSLISACSLDCSQGHGSSEEECQAGGCYVCGENRHEGSNDFCCVDDSLIDMYIGSKEVTIPAYFASIKDGDRLFVPNAADRSECFIYRRPFAAEIDPSPFVVFVIACIVISAGAYRVVSKERTLARWIWMPMTTQEGMQQRIAAYTSHRDFGQEQHSLSNGMVFGWVIYSTICLVVLFILVQYFPYMVVRVLQLAIAVSSVHALNYFFVTPFIALGTDLLTTRSSLVLPFFGHASKAGFVATLGTIISGITAIVWLIFRHQVWAWVLLDILAASLCFGFLMILRTPSLRVSTVLLSLFFIYDIIMVFFTPYLFSGKSIMYEVATAGREREEEDAFTCTRTQEEPLPILFVVPSLDYSWTKQSAMLGLGDVVLPGLLVVLALRFDYAKIRYQYQEYEDGTKPFPRPGFFKVHGYFIPIVFAYAIGLGCAFLANELEWTINGVPGQPALMYIVPAILITFIGLAVTRGDFRAVWGTAWHEWEEPRGVSQQDADLDLEEHSRRTPSL